MFRMVKSAPKSTVSTQRATRPYTVGAVTRACQILEAFASSSEVLDLKTITERSHLNKVTVFRILMTLAENDFIERVGNRGFRSRIQHVHGKRHRIGYAAQSSVVPFTAAVTDGLVEAAYAMNVDLLVLNNSYSASVALKNAERFIQEGVDLVIESQVVTKVASRLADKLAEAGIPVIAIDVPHPRSTYFGADNYKAGLMAGEYLGTWAAKNWNGSVDQLIFAGVDAAGSALDARLKGMYDSILKMLPNGRHVPVYHYDTKGHFDVTLDAIRKHIRTRAANKVLIGAVNDTSALAAVQAFREFGREDHCTVAGQGACLEAREEMRRRGTRFVCSVAYFPEMYGEKVIRLAIDLLDGRNVPPAVFTDHQLITPENVDRIYPNDVLLKTSKKISRRF